MRCGEWGRKTGHFDTYIVYSYVKIPVYVCIVWYTSMYMNIYVYMLYINPIYIYCVFDITLLYLIHMLSTIVNI